MKGFRVVLKIFGATAREAFSGKSGYEADGRWHSKGRFLDYAAQSRSLATLERLVHYKRWNSLAQHVIYEIDVPDVQIETVLSFPVGWNGVDLLPAAQEIGNSWRDLSRSPALLVPSAVVQGEHNVMINSSHPDWNWKWVTSGPVGFSFDERLVELVRRAQKSN